MMNGRSAVTIDMPTMTDSDWCAAKNLPVGAATG
jgi:hypothetical protein